MTSSLPHPPPAHEGAGGGEPWGRGTDKFGPRAQGVTTASLDVDQDLGLVAFVTARLDEEDITASVDALTLFAERAVAAMRAIVGEHADGGYSQGYTDTGYGGYEHACTCCGSHGEYGVPWPCATVRHLAAIWSDDPDYRAEWTP